MSFQGKCFVVKGAFRGKALRQRKGCWVDDKWPPGNNRDRRTDLELEKHSCRNEKNGLETPGLETGKFRAHFGWKLVQSHPGCILKTILECCAVTHSMHGPLEVLTPFLVQEGSREPQGVECEGNETVESLFQSRVDYQLPWPMLRL